MFVVVTVIQYMGKIPAVDARLLNSTKTAKTAGHADPSTTQ
jgi:hypothetical protein